jgi:hypothetical protein
MESLFTTGDFQKDMVTLKNTIFNAKIQHIEHVPKSKEEGLKSKEGEANVGK